MARFPLSEAEIVALAQNIIAGLTSNATIFPTPPIAPTALASELNAFLANQQDAVAAQAAAQQAVDGKNEALQQLTASMTSVLRYAENATNFDDAQLKTLGWGGRKARTSLQPAGQCRTLEAPRQGEGWVFLDWKEPIDGGKVAAYKVQRRERPSGAWQDVTTALVSEATLVEQERGKDLEYRVIAVNKAGEGTPSNSVAVVL